MHSYYDLLFNFSKKIQYNNGWWVLSLLPGFGSTTPFCLSLTFLFFFSYWKTFLLLVFLFYPGHWMRWCSVPCPSMSLLAGFLSPQSLLRSPKPCPCLWHFFKENFYWSFKYRNVFKAYWITINFHKINLSM